MAIHHKYSSIITSQVKSPLMVLQGSKVTVARYSYDTESEWTLEELPFALHHPFIGRRHNVIQFYKVSVTGLLKAASNNSLYLQYWWKTEILPSDCIDSENAQAIILLTEWRLPCFIFQNKQFTLQQLWKVNSWTLFLVGLVRKVKYNLLCKLI